MLFRSIILGYPWLERANPKINWKKKEFSWWEEGPNRINVYTLIREAIEGDVYETTEDLIISYLHSEIQEINDAWIKEQYGEPVEISAATVESPSQTLSDQWIQDKMTKSQLLTYQKNVGNGKPIEEIIPEEFHEFILTVFSERPIGTLPTRKQYNHAIDLKPDFVPYVQKPFRMDLKQREAVEEFIEENLAKGFIRRSDSRQATALFFVAKSDGRL